MYAGRVHRLGHGHFAIGHRRRELRQRLRAVGETRRPGMVAVVAPGIWVAVTDLVTLGEGDRVGRTVGYRSRDTALALQRYWIAHLVEQPEDQEVRRIAAGREPALEQLVFRVRR